jgi:hypothetical protein
VPQAWPEDSVDELADSVLAELLELLLEPPLKSV